jgi:hypothetical protein
MDDALELWQSVLETFKQPGIDVAVLAFVENPRASWCKCQTQNDAEGEGPICT